VRAVGSPLVGRARELDELGAALEGARSGSARLVLLRGEPGIGKTRLCDALSDRARASGFTVAWGRCWETPGAPAYWPWRQLCDELKLGPGELAGLLRGAEGSAEANRARLYEQLAASLRERAAAGPLLLVFEDLHAADLPSAQLLAFAVRTLRRSPVMWLLTARERDPRLSDELEGVLAKLAREGHRLQPSRLGRDAVAELARALLDRALPDATLDALLKTTEGTPLYVDGTLRLLCGEGKELPVPLPESAHDVLRDRLDLVPAACRSALELAAVAGHTFTRSLGGGDEALAPAIKAGLVQELSFDTLGFTHALLREALYQGLAPRRRAELHHAVLEALRRTSASDEELAHHALAALPLGSPAEAVALAVKAARHAESLLAFERAAELYERALAAEAEPGRRADLLVALAHCRIGAGGHPAGIAAAEAAAETARQLRDPQRLAAAALASGSVFRLGHVDASLIALLEEALAALGDAWPRLSVRIKARLASALQPADDARGPIALAHEAIAQARGLGDAPTLMSTLHFGLSALADLSDANEREPYLRELAALAADHRDTVLEHRTQARLAMCLYELGDVRGAAGAVARLERLAAGLGPSFRLTPLLFHSMRAVLDGRFDEADRLGGDIARLTEDLDTPEHLSTLGMQALSRNLLQCRNAELAPLIEPAVAAMAGTPMQAQGADCLCGAYLWLRAGDPARARAYLDRVSPRSLTYPDRGSLFWAGTVAGLLGDVPAAKLLEPALRACRQPFASGGLIGMSLDGPMSWPLALTVAALGKKTEALELLDRARAQCLAIGARPLALRILADRDTVAGTREHAAELAREAAALKMPGLVTAPPPPPAARAALSLAREGEGWLLSHGATQLRLKDSRGLQMLAALIAQPGREIHVLELSGSDASLDSDAGEQLDAAAKADYRDRLESLREELEEARAFNDSGRAARLQEELDFIAGELAAGVGLGGRSRKAGSNAERARVNVQRRLKDALTRIGEQSPDLGRALTRAVRTGTFCAFEGL